jgi:methyl-accepting chemotaxis protein
MFFDSPKNKIIQDLQLTVAHQTSLLEAINRSMASIEFDLNGVVLKANDNFFKTMRYRPEQVIGKEHRMFCTAEHARSPEYAQLWSRLRNGEFVTSTFQRVAGDGTTVWLEASYNPVRDADGKVIRVVKYAMDVTAKLQEESETRNKLQAIDRAMAVIEFNLDGTIIAANENLLRLLGYSRHELLGKNHRSLCPPELANSAEYQDFWRRLNKGEFFSDQFKRIGKHGQTLWLEASYNPVYDASGRLWKVVKFASDVTARIEIPTARRRLITSRCRRRNTPSKALRSSSRLPARCGRFRKTLTILRESSVSWASDQSRSRPSSIRSAVLPTRPICWR